MAARHGVTWVKTVRFKGFAEFTDSLREEAQTVFKRLKAEHKKTAMLTGDHAEVALALGRILQIDDIHAGLTPSKNRANQVLPRQRATGCDGRRWDQ